MPKKIKYERVTVKSFAFAETLKGKRAILIKISKEEAFYIMKATYINIEGIFEFGCGSIRFKPDGRKYPLQLSEPYTVDLIPEP